jgi:acyl-CoA synthetase (AMP-forming)/AMP-acid ligase II
MTIRLLLDMTAETYPDRVALTCGDESTTFGDLRAAAAAGSARLAAAGARSAAFLGVSSPVVPQLLFAAATAGIPFVPLNYRLAPAAIHGLLRRLDRPLVVADENLAGIARGAGGADVPVLTSREWRAGPAAEARAEPVAQQAPAVLLFTSGTTAEPKCAVLRHTHLLAYVLGTVEFASAGPSECALVSVPPYHVAGIGAVLTSVYSARRVVYLPDFTPASWLETVRRESVTHAMMVPTMLSRVVDELGGRPAEVPTLASLAYGGASMPARVLARALEAFPATGFTNAYGLTETSSTIAVLGPDDHRAAQRSPGSKRLASAGRIVPGVDAQIRSPDGGALPAGQTGELWVRGPQVSGEYAEAGAAGTRAAVDADGWFRTRDLAYLDADGYLFLAGRVDDVIIRGGENIAPAEVEDVLLEHPGVREAAVVGVPDAHWGQRLTAVVVAAAGVQLDPDDLRRHVRGRLRGSRTPDEVVIRTQLPYTPTGKVLRRALVEDLAAAASSRPSQLAG